MQCSIKIEDELINFNRNLNPHFYAIYTGKGIKYIAGMTGAIAFYQVNRMLKSIQTNSAFHRELELDHNAGSASKAIELLKHISECCLKHQDSVWLDMDTFDEIEVTGKLE